MPDIEKKPIDVTKELSPDVSASPEDVGSLESKPKVIESTQPAENQVTEESMAESLPPKPVPVRPVPVSKKDPLEEEIEEILSEDLEEIYKKLPPDRQQKFKEEGEKTAGIIREMIKKGKVHGRKLVGLIVRWLKMIPGVNKFFLEQESKIKADMLIEIAEEQKNKNK